MKFLTLNIKTLAMMFLISFVCTESGSGEDKLRTWTNASGKKKILLKLVRVAGNITTKNEKGNEVVAFEDANGKRYQTLVKNLSEFDQEFLANLKKELRPSDPAPSAPDARLPEKHRAFFTAHCLDCHDSETQEGEVDLETLSFHITTIEQAALWQKVLSALNSGEMPPKDSQQPGNKEKADFLDDLSLTMVTARKVLSDSGGKITMRRLNKRDYQNSIESLLGVRLGKELLPDDGSSGDFDTVGASLFLSSDKFEQYLKLGRHAIDEFYERRAARSTKPFVYRVEPEKNAQ